MKKFGCRILLCLGILFSLPHVSMAQDTISYLGSNFSAPEVDRVMIGDSLYVKFTHASKYIGKWEASTKGYYCELEFTMQVTPIDNSQFEILVGLYKLMKGDTIIIDHFTQTEYRSDFDLFAMEKSNQLDLLASAKGLVSLNGEFELLNASLDSAKLTLRSSEGIYFKQSEQREWIRREILKFFEPGVIFTRKER